MNYKYLIPLLLTLLIPARVYAVDGYIGLGIGQSEINQGFFGEYGNAYKIFGGLRLHPNLAVEVAYIDYGNPKETLFGIDTEYEASAYAVWAKGLWPVAQQFELLGKLGLGVWDITKTTTVFGLPPSTTTSDGTDFAWGVGAAFNYRDNFSIQLEYEDINSDIDTMTLWSISVLYKF